MEKFAKLRSSTPSLIPSLPITAKSAKISLPKIIKTALAMFELQSS